MIRLVETAHRAVEVDAVGDDIVAVAAFDGADGDDRGIAGTQVS